MIVVAKIGTSSITDEEGTINEEAVGAFCREVAAVRAEGHSVVAVTSGAIAAGLPALDLGGRRRPRDAETLQAVSAVGQSRLMRVYDRTFADLPLCLARDFCLKTSATDRACVLPCLPQQ